TVQWMDASSNEGGFRIERSLDGNTFAPVGGDRPAAPGTGSTVSFIDTGLSPGTKYFYRVWAFNAGAESAHSGPANGTTLPPPPAAPTILNATVVSSSEIDVAFRDNSTNETSFRLDRSTDGGATFPNSSSLQSSQGASQTITAPDNGLSPNTTY